MNYEALQDAFVAKLQPFATAGITVVRLPENEEERKKPKPTDVKLTVIYAGSEYSKPGSTAQVSQEETVFVQILIESTFLYGPKGVYNLASILKKGLTGFRAQGTDRFKVSKHHTIGTPDAEKKDNMWQYQVIFTATTLHVESFEEDLSILVKRITLKDGDETIQVPITPTTP
jgi:hypothetical protein